MLSTRAAGSWGREHLGQSHVVPMVCFPVRIGHGEAEKRVPFLLVEEQPADLDP